MTEAFDMPILGHDYRDKNGRMTCPRFVWPATQAHRDQALRNHGQTLERLRARGGLDWGELRWVLKGLKWEEDNPTEEVAERECKALYPQGVQP